MEQDFSRRLLTWFRQYGRHDLPWQHPRSPYRVWLSEIMLQQTQVATVIPYFERFVARFPDVSSLASASVDDVLALWAGLGYYSRARNLHKAARQIVNAGFDELPEDFEFLLALSGVGRSTAGAIMAQAYNRPFPILDGNVKRVLSRLYRVDGWPGSSAVERRLWELASAHTPASDVVDYTQALMDFGATVCRRSRPDCDHCPFTLKCRACIDGVVEAYPHRRPRKSTPLRKTTMLLLQRQDGAILLQKRPPSGIWGGMWSFPEVQRTEELADWLAGHWGLKLIQSREMAAFVHVFTHFRLEITPLHLHVEETEGRKVMEPGASLWYKSEPSTQLATPAPVSKLLQAIEK